MDETLYLEQSQCKEIKGLSRLVFVHLDCLPLSTLQKTNSQSAACQNPSTGQELRHEQFQGEF